VQCPGAFSSTPHTIGLLAIKRKRIDFDLWNHFLIQTPTPETYKK
jgi:hypothetical protein